MPRDDIDSVYYEDLDEDEDLDECVDNDKYRKIGSVRRLFKGFDSDYYKPIVIDRGFDERDNNYIKYRKNRDKHQNLSPEEYLNMIGPYLRDLINKHKAVEELNTTTNNNNNNNNNNNDTDHGEWKIQLTMIISCISTISFKDKRTMHSKSEAVEVYMGTDTKNVIDILFNTLLQNFQRVQEASNERRSKFIPDWVELLDYEFHAIDIRRAESYIMSLDWIASKKETINPKNEKDNKYFQ